MAIGLLAPSGRETNKGQAPEALQVLMQALRGIAYYGADTTPAARAAAATLTATVEGLADMSADALPLLSALFRAANDMIAQSKISRVVSRGNQAENTHTAVRALLASALQAATAEEEAASGSAGADSCRTRLYAALTKKIQEAAAYRVYDIKCPRWAGRNLLQYVEDAIRSNAAGARISTAQITLMNTRMQVSSITNTALATLRAAGRRALPSDRSGLSKVMGSLGAADREARRAVGVAMADLKKGEEISVTLEKAVSAVEACSKAVAASADAGANFTSHLQSFVTTELLDASQALAGLTSLFDDANKELSYISKWEASAFKPQQTYRTTATAAPVIRVTARTTSDGPSTPLLREGEGCCLLDLTSSSTSDDGEVRVQSSDELCTREGGIAANEVASASPAEASHPVTGDGGVNNVSAGADSADSAAAAAALQQETARAAALQRQLEESAAREQQLHQHLEQAAQALAASGAREAQLSQGLQAMGQRLVQTNQALQASGEREAQLTETVQTLQRQSHNAMQALAASGEREVGLSNALQATEARVQTCMQTLNASAAREQQLAAALQAAQQREQQEYVGRINALAAQQMALQQLAATDLMILKVWAPTGGAESQQQQQDERRAGRSAGLRGWGQMMAQRLMAMSQLRAQAAEHARAVRAAAPQAPTVEIVVVGEEQQQTAEEQEQEQQMVAEERQEQSAEGQQQSAVGQEQQQAEETTRLVRSGSIQKQRVLRWATAAASVGAVVAFALLRCRR